MKQKSSLAFDSQRSTAWVIVPLMVGSIWLTGCGSKQGDSAVKKLGTAKAVPVLSIAVSPDGKTVACCNRDNTLTLRDRDTLSTVRTLRFGDRLPVVARFHPNGDSLLVAYYDGTVGLWNLKAGTNEPALLGNHEYDVRSAAFSHDGRSAATGDGSGNVLLWNTADSNGGYRVLQHPSSVWSLAFTRDDQRLVSGSSDGSIRLWETASGRSLPELKGHQGPVRSLDVSRDGTLLVSAGLDSTVRGWNLADGREVFQIRCPGNGVVSAVVSPDAKTIAAATVFSGDINILDIGTRKLASRIPAHDVMVNDLVFARNGVLISCGMDGDVETWGVENDDRRNSSAAPPSVSLHVPNPTNQPIGG